MTLKAGDRVYILETYYDTGVVVEVERRGKGGGYDTLVKLDDEPGISPVPFDYHELKKIEA